jgi:hypothetical protein
MENMHAMTTKDNIKTQLEENYMDLTKKNLTMNNN